jgi:hypothetical protein
MPCGKGKRPYLNKDDAKRAKKTINKSSTTSKVTNIYWCDDCSAYHLTTMDKRKSRQITKRINKEKNQT